MKIKVKRIFNKKDTQEEKCVNKEEIAFEEKKSYEPGNDRRRKGAYENNKKININFRKYFDNLFRNKNKLSKGYYILLFLMLALGGMSVAITLKAYNLFAKEDYELYADDSVKDEDSVSTLSKAENVEKVDEKENNSSSVTNSAKAKVTTKTTTKKNTETTSTVKPLSFSKPISGEIQKPYSTDKVIYSKTLELWKTHDGIDISSAIGTNVKSIEKGIVEKVYEDSFYGITVVIDHGQGYKSSYSNLDKKVSVKAKQNINKGQVIGKISNTSIGEIKDDPHLHFMLFKDNNNVDPTYIFK